MFGWIVFIIGIFDLILGAYTQMGIWICVPIAISWYVILLRTAARAKRGKLERKDLAERVSRIVYHQIGDLKMVAYEFYRRVPAGNDHLIGILPERRTDPERVTYKSIMNRGKPLAPEDFLKGKVYFVRVEISRD